MRELGGSQIRYHSPTYPNVTLAATLALSNEPARPVGLLRLFVRIWDHCRDASSRSCPHKLPRIHATATECKMLTLVPFWKPAGASVLNWGIDYYRWDFQNRQVCSPQRPARLNMPCGVVLVQRFWWCKRTRNWPAL